MHWKHLFIIATSTLTLFALSIHARAASGEMFSIPSVEAEFG